MTTGESWVTHPLFPWLMIVLSCWVLFSIVVMTRNWVRLRRLEQYNARQIEKAPQSIARERED